jgi:putative glutamine amidotransferase
VFLPKASFALGIQWHPEFFSATTSVNQAIMKAFFEACERKHS